MQVRRSVTVSLFETTAAITPNDLENLDSVYFNEITTIRGHYLQAKAQIIKNKHDTEL